MAALRTVKRRNPNNAWTDALQRCGSATFSVRHLAPTRVTVAVVGDIDAFNARALGRYVERHVRMSKQLVLDLRAVEFAGAQAFTALYYISVHCARRDVDWIIIGSHHVRRCCRFVTLTASCRSWTTWLLDWLGWTAWRSAATTSPLGQLIRDNSAFRGWAGRR